MVCNLDNVQEEDNDFELDDSFDDFGDTGADKKKGVPKIFLVGGVILVVVLAIFLFGGGGDQVEVSESVVRGGTDIKQDAGTQELDATMLEATQALNEEDRGVAEDTGGSFIPVPTVALKDNFDDILVEEEEDEDPLEAWKSMQTERMRQEQFERTIRETQIQVQQEAQETTSRQETVTQLANAMSTNMASIIETQQIYPLTHMSVTDVEAFFQQPEGTAGSTSSSSTLSVGEIESEAPAPVQIISATTIEYGQTLIEANSDVAGPVLAELVTGPLRGARLLGSFKKEEEYLVIEFNTAVKDGKSYSINAIVLDPDTTLPAVATDINRRWFRRVILPAAASFIEGLGSAIAETSGTTVSVEGETVTETSDDLDTEEEIGKAVEKAAEKIAEIVEDEGADVETLVKVRAGTPIGILFLAPVFEEELNQQGGGAAVTSGNATGTASSSSTADLAASLSAIPGASSLPLDTLGF